ncbi:hypothetical protein M758_11G080800, partial [Ceratodon purpureus]
IAYEPVPTHEAKLHEQHASPESPRLAFVWCGRRLSCMPKILYASSLVGNTCHPAPKTCKKQTLVTVRRRCPARPKRSSSPPQQGMSFKVTIRVRYQEFANRLTVQ